MDRLHHWKLSKPVVKLNPFCGQGLLYPRGILKFLIGLIIDFSGRLIEAPQLFQEVGEIGSGFSPSAERLRRFLQSEVHKSLVDFIFSLHIIGPPIGRDGLGK
jgi:hypothetical protein